MVVVLVVVVAAAVVVVVVVVVLVVRSSRSRSSSSSSSNSGSSDTVCDSPRQPPGPKSEFWMQKQILEQLTIVQRIFSDGLKQPKTA